MNSISSILQQALAFHRNAELARAKLLYEEILSLDPKHFDALQLLGTIATQTKQWDLALDRFEQALIINSSSASLFYNRGLVLQELRRFNEALESYERAVNLKPDYAEAHSNQGVILKNLGHLESALVSFDKALSYQPFDVRAHSNRAVVLKDLNRLNESLSSCEMAIKLDPNFAEAHYNKGNVLQELKRFEPALQSYENAIKIKCDYPEAHLNRGSVLKELNRNGEALACFDEAIKLRADYCEAYFNRGMVLYQLNRSDEALINYDTAIQLKDDYVDCYLNRGVILQERMLLDEALESYEKAIAIKDLAEAHWNKSLVLLAKGDFEKGFAEYEWGQKTKKPQRGNVTHFTQPLWLGRESLQNKTILIYSEQGLGDTLQFCRYVKLVKELGARVLLEVQKPLFNVLQNLDGIDLLLIEGGQIPEFDYQCPLLSLPLAFNTRLNTVPNQIPYILADTQKVAYWRAKLGTAKKPRVGLVWSGGFRPDQPEVWAVNARRNIPLHFLAELKTDGVEFFSLQKGEPAESEFKELMKNGWNGPEIIDYTDELKDFSDTAALIHNLDLVISVDTSTAHLAAAMGKPVWILNRFDTCWRWLLEIEDSPWYPSVTLFRQSKTGDWSDVIARVIDTLEQEHGDLG